MATLADALRQTGYSQDGTLVSPSTDSPMTKALSEHIKTLPQQLATNQAALDSAIGSWNKTDFATGQPNPNYRPEAIQEVTAMMPIAGTVKNIAKSLQDKGLIMDVYESSKEPKITLSRIVVPKEMRGTGMGTEALSELAQYADETGKTVALSPSKDFGATSVDRLKDFYKRFGFVENKGKNKDFSISESMYRIPAQPSRKELIEKQMNRLE